MKMVFGLVVLVSCLTLPSPILATREAPPVPRSGKLENVLLYNKHTLPFIKKKLDNAPLCSLKNNEQIRELGLGEVIIMVLMDPAGFAIEERCPGGPVIIPLDKMSFSITLLAIEFQRREQAAKHRSTPAQAKPVND